MNSPPNLKVESLLSQINQILMRGFSYPEDQTAEIENAIATWHELPFVRYYEEGLCATKAKTEQRSQMERFSSYISKGDKI